jgi:aminobenzoyl-glutamate utilization protein A
MHACGHDVHMAAALELAERLVQDRPPCTVKLVFQPAEEGLRGARPLAESGVLDDVDELICLHVGLGLPLGTVATAAAGSLGSTKHRATFTGKAAHASLAPEAGRHALLAASAAALTLHTLPQRSDGTCRVNVGSLNAPGSPNIIPGQAQLTYEVRGDSPELLSDLSQRAVEAINGSAMAFGVTAAIQDLGGAPAIACDSSLARQLAAYLEKVSLVEDCLLEVQDPASDDASWLIERVRTRGGRGTYMVVGADQVAGHHDPAFDVDERALDVAVEALLAAVQGLAREPRTSP